MTHPEMDYWKEKPAKLLLDERLTGMTPEELMAWFWLRQRARTQTPPGVLSADDGKLQRWSGLTPAQWKRARVAVLRCFGEDAQGRLHDPETKAEYLDYCMYKHRESVENTRKANIRWKKKDQDPRFFDPYANFPMQRHAAALPVQSPGTPENGVSESKMQEHAAACSSINKECSGTPNRLTNLQVSLPGAEPPPSKGGAVSPEPPDPLHPHAPPASPHPLINADERTRRSQEHRALFNAQLAEIERQQQLASAPPSLPSAPAADAAGDADPEEIPVENSKENPS